MRKLELILFLLFFLTEPVLAQSRYPVGVFQSKLWSEDDKAKLQIYFKDDYLVKKRESEMQLEGQRFFQFLSATGSALVREELRDKPFDLIPWPDNLEFIELYMQEMEMEKKP